MGKRHGMCQVAAFVFVMITVLAVQSKAAINIALNKPASTNKSIWSDDLPSKAVDGDITTWWSANHHGNPDDPTWLKVDLEEVFSVEQIVLKVRTYQSQYAGHYIDYILYSSEDGVVWDEIGQGRLIDFNDPIDTIELNGESMRYVRYDVIGGTHWANLHEMEVYEEINICPSGSALDFDGDNDYVDCGDDSSLDVTELTWSLWIKRSETTYSNERALISNTGRENVIGTYALQIDDGGHYQDKIQFVRHGDHVNQLPLSATAINNMDWHHIAVTRDVDGHVSIYIDGLEDATGSVAERTAYSRTVIGTGNTNYSNFNGMIDEVRIYNSVLSAEEIIATSYTKLTGGEPNLVGCWDFDEGDGQVAYDLSINANHGTLGSGLGEDGSDPMWIASDAPVGDCPIIVGVDIKPGDCPNPMNVSSKGVLPVAVSGTGDFDVHEIEAASIRLAGVAPIRNSYEDVSSPAADSNECDCGHNTPDGFMDLTLKFRTQDIVGALLGLDGGVESGDVFSLELTGVLSDSTKIEGSDCVVIRGKVPRSLEAAGVDINGDGRINMVDFGKMAGFWLESAAMN